MWITKRFLPIVFRLQKIHNFTKLTIFKPFKINSMNCHLLMWGDEYLGVSVNQHVVF